MTLNKVLKILPTLNQSELATVRATAEHLLEKGTVDPTTPLYEVMTRLLGLGLSYRDFHHTRAYAVWHKSAPKVVSFVELHWPRATKVARSALYAFMLEILIDDLKGRNAPITLGVLVTNLSRLPQLTKEAFPDYLESGMAHLILRAMTKREKESKDAVR